MNVVVTGGGTVAPIDEVRQITNVSSGRFSAALSEACLGRGASVWHLHAPAAHLPIPRAARLDLTLSGAHTGSLVYTQDQQGARVTGTFDGGPVDASR